MTSPHHSEPMGENHDDPSIAPTVFTVVVFVAVFIITLIGLEAYFGRAASTEEQEKVVEPTTVALKTLRDAQLARIASYRWVSADSGIVAIPIGRAMEIEAVELAQQSASPPPPAKDAVKPAVPGAPAKAAAAPNGAGKPAPAHRKAAR